MSGTESKLKQALQVLEGSCQVCSARVVSEAEESPGG